MQVWNVITETGIIKRHRTQNSLPLEHPCEQYCECFSAELQRRELGSEQQGAAAIIQSSGEKSMSQQSAWGPYDPTPHQPTNSRGTYQSTSSPYDSAPHQPTNSRGTYQSTSSPYDPTPHQPTNSRGTYQSTSSPYDPTPHQPTSGRGTHQNTISLPHVIQHPTN